MCSIHAGWTGVNGGVHAYTLGATSPTLHRFGAPCFSLYYVCVTHTMCTILCILTKYIHFRTHPHATTTSTSGGVHHLHHLLDHQDLKGLQIDNQSLQWPSFYINLFIIQTDFPFFEDTFNKVVKCRRLFFFFSVVLKYLMRNALIKTECIRKGRSQAMM